MTACTDPQRDIPGRLFALQDKPYRDFISRLVPNIAGERFIGVRIPQLRRVLKDAFAKEGGASFLEALPHGYFEEDMLHAFLIGRMEDYGQALVQTRIFLPYVDNWAVCDSLAPGALMRRPDDFYEELKLWIRDSHPYTQRFAVVRLLGGFLEEGFKPETLGLVCALRSDEYYVNMAIAWFLSEALLKQYPLTLPVFQSGQLGKFVHNKGIQKAIESRRISAERKEILRSLRKP